MINENKQKICDALCATLQLTMSGEELVSIRYEKIGPDTEQATLAKVLKQQPEHDFCGRCKYEFYPEAVNPCRNCMWNVGMHTDNWEPKESNDGV